MTCRQKLSPVKSYKVGGITYPRPTIETLNIQDFFLQQVEDRAKAMRKRDRKRLDKIERGTPARNPMGKALWNKGHSVEKVGTKYNRKKIKKAVDIYRDTEI